MTFHHGVDLGVREPGRPHEGQQAVLGLGPRERRSCLSLEKRPERPHAVAAGRAVEQREELLAGRQPPDVRLLESALEVSR